MAGSVLGRMQPWFTINEFLSKDVTASTSIDVTKITAVCFDSDVEITIGGLGTAFSLTSGTPLGIDNTTASISVDADCFMFAMGGR